jgi:hypothetical protein
MFMPTRLVYICHPARKRADSDFQKKMRIAFGKRIDRRRDDQKEVPIRFRICRGRLRDKARSGGPGGTPTWLGVCS